MTKSLVSMHNSAARTSRRIVTGKVMLALVASGIAVAAPAGQARTPVPPFTVPTDT